MPQLPSGRKVALTIEPMLKEIEKGNFGINFLTEIYFLDTFDALPEVVTIIYLNDPLDASEPTQVYQPGTQSIDAGKYQFSKLILADVGTERCDWPQEDIEYFRTWLSGSAAQQWLRKSYDELVEAIKTTKTTLPESLKGIFDVGDEDFPSVNLDKPEQDLPDSVIELIGDLIKRDNVQSVSFPFNNTKVWRLLVDEQLRRAKATGLPIKKVFPLSGPDSGLSCDPAQWGGDVHIPYEGTCMGDLFVVPHWRKLYPDWKDEFPHAGDGRGDKATLGDYAHYMADPKIGFSCHYLLMQRDIGELKCATRREIGEGWILYESNRPYVKVNMFGIQVDTQ